MVNGMMIFTLNRGVQMIDLLGGSPNNKVHNLLTALLTFINTYTNNLMEVLVV